MPSQEFQQFNAQQNQNQSTDNRDSDMFYTYNYGGLNTESSIVNMPFSDSPTMLNMDVTLSGRLKKRGGSVLRNRKTAYPSSIIVPVKLLTGEYLIWEKKGTGMIGWLLPSEDSNNSVSETWDYTGMFSTLSANERPSWVITNEDSPRLIMVQPSTCPVEIKFNQQKVIGNGTTSLTLVGDKSTIFNTTYTYVVFQNTVIKVTGVNYSAPSTTITLASALPSGQVAVLVNPVFAWWSEAIKRTSEQVFASQLRFNTSKSADANVEVPTEIRRGLLADHDSYGMTGAAYASHMPCVLHRSATATSFSLFTHDAAPTTDTTYAWSDLQYVGTGATDRITPGTTYITFGAITGTGTSPPTPVLFCRYPYLPFNGNSTRTIADIYVNNDKGTQYTLTSADGTLLNDVNRYSLVAWSGTAFVKYDTADATSTSIQGVTFDAATPLGIGDTSLIEVSYKTVNSTYQGSACVDSYTSGTVHGGFRPCYGISEYANYATGSFPSIIAFFQNRICLAGFPAAPLTVLMSNINDYSSRVPFQNFQIYIEDPEIADNPVEVVISGTSNAAITGMIEWFNSLFVFTENSLYRLHGGDLVAITPTNKFLSNVATIGCKSPHSIGKTDRNVVFLSESGLYKVEVLPEVGDYYVQSISLKVQRIFTTAKKYLANSWIAWNDTDKLVYVGISDGSDISISQRLLTFNTEREAWSEYSIFTGFMPSSYGVSIGNRFLIQVVNRDTAPTVTASSSSILNTCEFNRNYYIDFYQTTAIANPLVYTILGSPAASVSLTISEAYRLLDISKATVGNKGFKLLPVDNYYNTEVVYTYSSGSTATLSGGTDYFHDSLKNRVRMAYYPWNTGDTIRVSLLDAEYAYPVVYYRNNVKQEQDTNYTVSIATGDYIVTVTDTLDASDSIYFGLSYPSYHMTPTFFREKTGRLKRTYHYIGYYSNRDYLGLYSSADVNTSAGQDPLEIVDRFKQYTNLRVAMIYEDTRTGTISSDLYTQDNFFWDVSLFDYSNNLFQEIEVVRIVEPIIGMGYSFRCCNFSFDETTFELIGYEIDTGVKGKNSKGWY